MRPACELPVQILFLEVLDRRRSIEEALLHGHHQLDLKCQVLAQRRQLHFLAQLSESTDLGRQKPNPAVQGVQRDRLHGEEVVRIVRDREHLRQVRHVDQSGLIHGAHRRLQQQRARN